MRGYNTVVINERIQEPCNTVVNEWRQSLNRTSSNEERYSPGTVFKFANARAQMHKDWLRPRLADFDIVILDRSYLTNCVYQTNSGLSWDEIYCLHHLVGITDYERAAIIDIPPSIALDRATKRNQMNYLNGGGYVNAEGIRQPIPAETLDRISSRRNDYMKISESLHIPVFDGTTNARDLTELLIKYLIK